jgi:hypothetical protein
MISIPQTDCRLCSEVSKAHGEDPIGSAATWNLLIVVEIPQPWTDQVWSENPIMAFLDQQIDILWEQGISVRALMIAPDPAHCRPGYTRLLSFRRPAPLFSHYDKQDYWIPSAEVISLADGLLNKPESLSQFTTFLQPTQHLREILVCTHGNVDLACSRFGFPIYERIRTIYALQASLRVWRCSHFGGHRFAPTLIDMPEGRYWGHLDPESLDQLICRQGSLESLRFHYRGWAGLETYEQILERELWMRLGWDWIHYPKAGATLTLDTSQEEADWAEVQIQYDLGSKIESVVARVEAVGYAITKSSSSSQTLSQVKRYQVVNQAF